MQGINPPHASSASVAPAAGSASPAPRATAGAGKAPAAKRYPRSFWWYLKMFFIALQMVVFCLIVVVLAVGKGLYDQLSKIVPDVQLITQRNKASQTLVYAADKKTVLARFKGERRAWVPIETLKVRRKWGNRWVTKPGRLIDATLSVEDSRFYTHPGMDAKRIVKAAYVNFTSGNSTAQGGSTITEQLARNIYFKRNKTHSQRLQAALLALQLERRFTKDEVLELYLNEIEYGPNIDGCEAAAQTYLNKPAKDLTIAEAALIAGLPQSPSKLNPFKYYDRAQKRQRIVLHEMLQNRKISYSQWEQARRDTNARLRVAMARQKFLAEKRAKKYWIAPYFVSYVKSYLQKNYGWSEAYIRTSGLKIYTTIDLKLQAIAESQLRRRLDRLGQSKLQGALVCIDPWTGHVLAMVGGREYYKPGSQRDDEFNRATQAKRQPGSTFKPYVYAAAMEAGYSPNSTEKDSKLRIWGTTIKNYDFKNRGWMSLREAIGMSNNVVATKTMLKLGNSMDQGIQTVVQKAHLMGIESALVPYPSLALGASEVTLLEHTSAFGVFATRGLRAEETPIDRVVNSTGETLIEHAHPVRGPRVLSEDAGNKMWDMLRYVVVGGTGKNAQIPGVDVIGKTGTTSDNKDVWFMGATRQLACGVWMGYDRPRDLGYGAAGGKWCAPLWRNFMIQALDVWRQRNPVERMIESTRMTDQRLRMARQTMKVVTLTICDDTGKLANAACPSTRRMQFSTGGDLPGEHCDVPAHQNRVRPVRALGYSGGAARKPQLGDLGYDPAAEGAVRREFSDGAAGNGAARRNTGRGGRTPSRRDAARYDQDDDSMGDGPMPQDGVDDAPPDLGDGYNGSDRSGSSGSGSTGSGSTGGSDDGDDSDASEPLTDEPPVRQPVEQ